MEHVLGRYELLEELGRGAMGVVYKARDPVLNRIVAIKTMSAESADDEELRSRLTREANAAAKLKHPNIVTIHDYGEHAGIPFIALEYLEGIDLKQIIRNRINLYPREKLGILKQVALGLGHAHKMGVVHRDVKPGNIRILRDGTVKIMDFGIARIDSSQMTRVGTVLGSVDYMSPEQVEGRQADPRCDQFGFGVVAYELVSEKLPFRADNMPATMNNILRNDPPPLPEHVLKPFPGLEGVIAKCLQKIPTERFESFQDIAREIERMQMLMVREDATHTDFRGVAPSVQDAEQETVVFSESESSQAAESEDWQGGDRTVSSVRLWVSGDRFQKISASLESLEQEKAKRPVGTGAPPRTRPPRSAATSRAPSASIPPPEPSRSIAVGIAVLALVVVVIVAGWLVVGRKGPPSGVEEFVAARLEASQARMQAEDYRGAITELERVLEVQPGHAEAQARLAEARAGLDDRFDEIFARARELVAAGDLAGASREIGAALGLKPDHAEAVQLREQIDAGLRERESAQDQQARVASLIATGRNHLQAGRASEAIATLRAAAALQPANREVQLLLQQAQQAQQAEAQRGQAEQAYRAGVAALERSDFGGAIQQLESALELDPGHARARARLEEARREQARPRFGTLTVNALPFGEAFLDGESVGTTPVRLERVAAGRHTVRVVKDGYREFTRTVAVEEGQTTNVVAQLEKNP